MFARPILAYVGVHSVLFDLIHSHQFADEALVALRGRVLASYAIHITFDLYGVCRKYLYYKSLGFDQVDTSLDP